jgi:thiamine-phosphate pyrophosphorylase
VVEAVSVPIIAIGGIGADNVSEIRNAGAHGIAVISAVCCRKNPEAATHVLYQAFHTAVS